MKLIYFYPKEDNAPANLARELYSAIKIQKDLNLCISLYPYNDLYPMDSCSLKDLLFSSNEFVCVHMTTSPFFVPTKRFLLHLVAILKRIPIILNYHGDIQIETMNQFKNNNWYNFFEYLPSFFFVSQFLKNAEKVVVNSYNMKCLVEKKYNVSNVCVIPNAINDFWFSESKSKIHLEGCPSIFYHGRLSYEKGVDLLIKGFAKSKRSGAILYISGSGDQLNYLKSIVEEEGIINNVKFLGKITHSQIKMYLLSADLAIYPSRYEAFSLAILEAFATLNGIVFYSNKAGINDFVDNMNFELRSFEPTVDEIANIIRNHYSAEEVEHIVSMQKKFAKLFTWDSVSTQYLQVYNELKTKYKTEKMYGLL
ncbi:MAG: glycosyltransferase family 4 protein [Methanosarcina sp.]|jgi:glycogen(starch) synthase